MFITNDDYSVLVRNEIKDVLLDNYTEAKLRAAEQMAIAQVKNYLSGRYDVQLIFEAQGNERNSHIVMVTLDCALYHLYTSTVPRKMPDIRSQRYQDSIDWLKLVAEGKAYADLPKVKSEQGEELLGLKISSKYEANNNRW